MSVTDLVLIHSPLVGPLTWRPVAERLTAAGYRVTLPELTAALAGDPPYQARIARAVADALPPSPSPVTLVGHSGAGPLLPGIAAASPRPVRALVYVDALLPYPGEAWFDRAPAELAAHLRALATDGVLPPWHEWFGAGAVAALLPEPHLRAAFLAELPRLPLAYFAEPTGHDTWSGPAGYLLLSDAYRTAGAQARASCLPVVEELTDHLAMLTRPDPVAAALRRLLGLLGA